MKKRKPPSGDDVVKFSVRVELRLNGGVMEKRIPGSAFPAWRDWVPVEKGFNVEALRRDPSVELVWR